VSFEPALPEKDDAERGVSTWTMPEGQPDALAEFGVESIGMERAMTYAERLANIIRASNLSIKIGQSNHLRIEAWETLGMMVGLVARVDQPPVCFYDEAGEMIGCRVHATVHRLDGTFVGSAYSRCDRIEVAWEDKAPYAIEGMAQTRAMSRALASILRWIPVLAGYSGTPAEEMIEPRQGSRQRPSRAADIPMEKPQKPPQTQQAPPPDALISDQERSQLWATWKDHSAQLHLDEDRSLRHLKLILGRFGYSDTKTIARAKLGAIRAAIHLWNEKDSHNAEVEFEKAFIKD